MEKLSYTIQCTDKTSGKAGCFVYDEAQCKRVGYFIALSPVFDDLMDFYKWINQSDCPFLLVGNYMDCNVKRKG